MFPVYIHAIIAAKWGFSFFFFLTVFEEVSIWIVNNYFSPISSESLCLIQWSTQQLYEPVVSVEILLGSDREPILCLGNRV